MLKKRKLARACESDHLLLLWSCRESNPPLYQGFGARTAGSLRPVPVQYLSFPAGSLDGYPPMHQRTDPGWLARAAYWVGAGGRRQGLRCLCSFALRDFGPDGDGPSWATMPVG